MAKYPKIQGELIKSAMVITQQLIIEGVCNDNYFADQVQDELRRVIGDRMVQVSDRKNLPFTDAVIHEIQRLASIVPTALPHKTSKDVTFQGYFIKKVGPKEQKNVKKQIYEMK